MSTGHLMFPVRVDLPHLVTQLTQEGSIWGNGQTFVMVSNGSLWAWALTGSPSWATGERNPSGSDAVPPARGRHLPESGRRAGHVVRRFGDREGMRMGCQCRRTGR